MIKRINWIGLLISASLAGCGGGGASGGSVQAPITVITPAPTTLIASGGDLSKYLGTWKSECGYNVIGTNQGKSQINTWTFTAVNGNVATGTLLVDLYDGVGCTKYASGPGNAAMPIVVTYQGSLAVTSGMPADMAGTVDQLTLSAPGSTTSQPWTIGFNVNFTKFYQGTTSFFNGASLSSTKQ